MATVRELLTKFSFSVDQSPLNSMRGALRSVGDDLRKTFDTKTIKDHEAGLNRVVGAAGNLRDTLGNVAKGAVLLGGALSAVGAGIGVAFAGVKSTADYADRIKDTSDQLGIASGELQALGYVAQLSGSNTDELSASLRFLARNAVESAENAKGPAADGFRKLGVSGTSKVVRLFWKRWQMDSQTFPKVPKELHWQWTFSESPVCQWFHFFHKGPQPLLQ